MENNKSIKNILINMPSNIFNLFLKHKKLINFKSKNFTYLGAGSEGIVYEVDKYAIKIIYNKKSAKEMKEAKILQLCKQLIADKVTIHFLELFDLFKKDNYDILILNLIDGNLLHWFTTQHSDTEWINMLLQLTYSILVMQSCLKMYHSDLKPKNILYKNLSKPQLIKYIIKANNETIEFSILTDIIFYISDFGTAESLLSTNNPTIKQSIELHIQKNTDMSEILSFYNRLLVSILQDSYQLDDLLKLHNTDPFFNEYYKSELKTINEKFNQISQGARNKLLLRSLIYYLLEKKSIDINKIPNLNSHKVKLPSNEIRKLLENMTFSVPTLDIIKNIAKYAQPLDSKPDITLCIKL